jgi:hypothetical protein
VIPISIPISMRTRKSTPETCRMSALAFGILLYAGSHITRAAGVDEANPSPAASPVYAYFREAPAHLALDVGAAPSEGVTVGAIVRVGKQAAQYRPDAGSARGASSAVDASLSDLLARHHYPGGGGVGLSSDHARQDEREVLLTNSDALVGAKIQLTLGEERLAFLYADMGAADSALRWQGLAGIRGAHGVDVLGGWRRVTYHFSPGRGFDSLDFNGPFLGAMLAW